MYAGNETAERMAFFGILVNLLFYLYYEMHISFPEASTLVTNVVGTSALTPLLGAFLADAYLGRFWTIGIFSMIYLLVSRASMVIIEVLHICSYCTIVTGSPQDDSN